MAERQVDEEEERRPCDRVRRLLENWRLVRAEYEEALHSPEVRDSAEAGGWEGAHYHDYVKRSLARKYPDRFGGGGSGAAKSEAHTNPRTCKIHYAADHRMRCETPEIYFTAVERHEEFHSNHCCTKKGEHEEVDRLWNEAIGDGRPTESLPSLRDFPTYRDWLRVPENWILEEIEGYGITIEVLEQWLQSECSG